MATQTVSTGTGSTAHELMLAGASAELRHERMWRDAQTLGALSIDHAADIDAESALIRAQQELCRIAEEAIQQARRCQEAGARVMRHHRADIEDAANRRLTAYVTIRSKDGAEQRVSGIPTKMVDGLGFCLGGAEWRIGDVLSVTVWEPRR